MPRSPPLGSSVPGLRPKQNTIDLPQTRRVASHRIASRRVPWVASIVSHRTTTVATMFFLYNLERRVTLHPSYFGKNMHELVTGKLLKDVEGTCTGSYYIITIMDTFDISEGRILPGSGLAEFTVGYRAVVWRPFKGETVWMHPSACLPAGVALCPALLMV